MDLALARVRRSVCDIRTIFTTKEIKEKEENDDDEEEDDNQEDRGKESTGRWRRRLFCRCF